MKIESLKKLRIESTYRKQSTKRYTIKILIWRWSITVVTYRKEYKINAGKTIKII